MDHATTLTVIHAGFGDILIQAAIVAVAGLWACVPFSVFGVRRRLDSIADAQRDHSEALTEELRRFRNLAVTTTAAPVRRETPEAPAPMPRRSPRVVSAA
ncbi:hypothetical protein ABIE65_003319 [Constrictibacter sp. MBR-5]|jgi:hypothetical protein|uniref:hypothetical protein n=1 Tax=Constrictibacter sp. MBR-5 TaxID=3156467 RepID=UPI003391417E